MKTKMIWLTCISILVSACASQVTVTSEVTVTSPPPTETPIPTPTLHPDFIARQKLFTAIDSSLALNPDGTVQYGDQTVQGLSVSADGKISIMVEETQVEVTVEDLTFDNEKGLIISGYEQNEEGKWVEAGPRG